MMTISIHAEPYYFLVGRILSWRLAPWIKPMQVQNAKRAKPFLVVVNRAIVYPIIEFSHRLALHLTAYSARDTGLRRWQAFGGRAAMSYPATTWEGRPVIRRVVCDMDGVPCRYRIERRLALLASWRGQTPETIHAAIWGSRFEDDAERGVLSADDYVLGFGERMHYPLSAAQWVEARRVAMEPDQAVLALARRLRRACAVGMFTNNPWLWQRHLAEVFPAVPALFGPRAVFSAEVGRSQPDPEAFRRLATRLECTPEDMLYFDDDASYGASARAVGLSAYQVGGAAGVRTGLTAQGLQRC
jgi:putative hydrolase of the HAD superfamily